jgi:hypothetical protein
MAARATPQGAASQQDQINKRVKFNDLGARGCACCFIRHANAMHAQTVISICIQNLSVDFQQIQKMK